MSTTITGIGQTKILTNLDTYVHTALATNFYFVGLTLSEVPPSGLSIVIKQNSTTIVTSAAPSSTQQTISLQTVLACAVNDTISVIISSTTPTESNPNSFKGILKINQGIS